MRIQVRPSVSFSVSPFVPFSAFRRAIARHIAICLRQAPGAAPRKAKPFYSFGCGSVGPDLLPDIFLGHEKDAFPGAAKAERGLIELANGGTLFLEDVGRLPFDVQDVLLQFIENGCITRLGGSKEIDADVRIIASTSGNLAELVHDGKFGAELFMRLNVAQLRIPPLRERREDIGVIADAWWCPRHNRKHLSQEQIAALCEYDFPGNVQEVYRKYGQSSSKAASALKITRNTLRKYLHD